MQHHLSILLFVGFACGLIMLLSTKLLGAATLSAFTGPKNAQLVPAANTYVQVISLLILYYILWRDAMQVVQLSYMLNRIKQGNCLVLDLVILSFSFWC